MVPHDLPLHAGMMPRLLITIVGEPVAGADRYEQDPLSKSAAVRCKKLNQIPNNNKLKK